MQDKKALPYILGGKQMPRCTNCKADRPWAHTCQFDGQGSICTPEAQVLPPTFSCSCMAGPRMAIAQGLQVVLD